MEVTGELGGRAGARAARARCAPTPTRATCSRPTRACTRVEPLRGRLPARRRRRRRGGRASPRGFGVPVVAARRRHQPRRPDRRRARARARHLAPHGRDRRDRRRRAARARRARASCRRTSTAPPQRYGLGFGPDTSTSNRATLGGMIGNNSSGSDSIVYGTTIDHVLELEVVLADGSRAHVRPVDEPSGARAGRRSRARSTAAAGDPARPRAARSPRTTRSTGASPAATGSTASTRGSTSRKLVVGSEGTLAAITEATRRAGRAAEGEDVRRRALRLGRRARSRRPRTRSRSSRAAVEMIDRTILELSRSKLEYRRAGRPLEGDPDALLFVTFFGDTRGRGRATSSTGSRRLARARPRLPHAARRDRGRAGRADQGPQGRPRAC